MSLDAENCAPVTFQPDEVEELHWLLGQLEDWLLHASDETLDELGDFVTHDCYPPSAVPQIIGTLGAYGVKLRRRGESPP